jgi:transcriptional regulator with XRE-family HTH domain
MLANDTPTPPHPVDGENMCGAAQSSLWPMNNLSALTQPTPESVANRLRSIRKSRGWTLHDVESKSGGSIKAVVMGSYERGTRAISLARALELANLFAIPIADLLSDPTSGRDENLGFRRFDQRRIAKLLSEKDDEALRKVNKFLTAIAQRRGDWNGEILTLRSTDLDTLTLILEMSQTRLAEWLKEENIAFG